MNYKITVKIENPNTPKGMESALTLKLNCAFIYDKDNYGNGHTLSIKNKEGYTNYYDIRYDKTFRKKEKISYLAKWAENYWSGENGAYKLKYIEIEKE